MNHALTKSTAVACWTLVVAASLAPAVTRPEITAPYTADSISIDGQVADWDRVKTLGEGIAFYKGDGQAGSSTNLGTTICRQIDDEEDCRVDLWLAHDTTYLYVLAEVHDDDHEPFDAANQNNMAYLEDTLHLYVDSTNAQRSNIPNPPIYNQAGYEQFGISTDGNIWGEHTDFNTSGIVRQPAPKGSHPDGTYWLADCEVQAISGGYLYVFEERIALAGYPGRNMAAMTPGNHYGFDAEFCDADYGTQLQGFTWWSSNGYTDAWNYQNLWGTMHLEPAPIPGDANRDGTVTDQDAAILATHWQQQSGASWGDGDFNGDGEVTDQDAAILATHWQQGTESSAVPEPGLLVLLAGALLSLLVWQPQGWLRIRPQRALGGENGS